METKHNTHLLIAGAIVVAVGITVGGYYYYMTSTFSAPDEATPSAANDSVSAQVSGAAQTPADKLPETNPFEAKTNPFTQYQNPFE